LLVHLRLRNFRGFEDHSLSFRETTVAVGRNNAGKSTFIEALRLVSIVTARFRSLNYRRPPDWLDVPVRLTGAAIDLSNLQIEFETLFYEYGDPPAEIEVAFNDGKSVRIFIGGEKMVHAVLLDEKGHAVVGRSQALGFSLDRVAILPQISPLAREEKILTRDHVLGAIDSPLSSSHFRNQLRYLKDLLPEFRKTAEETWPGLQILELTYGRGYPGDTIFLQVRNDEFVGEVGKMGHGLQMWLQCIWFLVRSKQAETLILDEPDVYMHADLQRKLMRYLDTHRRQVVVATHSAEIISEVEPQDILIIERKRKSSRFADSIPAVQRVLERVGSTQNIHLARLWNAKRFLIVEGDDLRILKRLHDTLFPTSLMSLDAIPNMAIGGWGGWAWAVGSSLAMKNAFGESVHTYCILDRDYHSDEEIAERECEAKERDVDLYVWKRKELENYLLDPSAIAKALGRSGGKAGVSPEAILDTMRRLADRMEDEVIDGVSDGLYRLKRGLTPGGANKKARVIVESRRSSERGLVDVVSGKSLLTRLSAWSQKKYGVGLSAAKLARHMGPDLIPDEARAVLTAIERLQPFAGAESLQIGTEL